VEVTFCMAANLRAQAAVVNLGVRSQKTPTSTWLDDSMTDNHRSWKIEV